MIDVSLFSHLLASIKAGARLILMGDHHQLPPVGAGSLFADLVESVEKTERFPCTVLKSCLRSNQRGILSLADAINRKDGNLINSILNNREQEGISWLDIDLNEKTSSTVYEKLWEHIKDEFPQPSFHPINQTTVSDLLTRYCILSCMRKGPLGVDALNQMIVHRFLSIVQEGQWWVVPILITRSDYDLELFNGETGLLIRKCKKGAMYLDFFHEEDYAIFTERGPNQTYRKIAAINLPSFEYAYCLSVHKSQGSEYDTVLLIAPLGSEVFGKEVIYTGATRAKMQLQILAKEETLHLAVERPSRKISGLHARLKKIYLNQEKDAFVESKY
jgi:exodeoxyribonuclease V alpha subunit